MVYTPEGVTDNITNVPMTSTPVKKPSVRKSLCLFTNILNVKPKTAKCRIVAENHGHVICKNWPLCGMCWEDCKHKIFHVTTSPDLAESITRLLKKACGERLSCLKPSGNRKDTPLENSSYLNLTHQSECGRQTGAL